MIGELWVAMTFLALLALGFLSPVAMALTYVWTDLFYPQLVASTTLGSIPCSMIAGVLAILSYVIRDRKFPARITSQMVLILTLEIWVNCTMLWAVSPEMAFPKWSVVVKMLFFVMLLPFIFRSRVQIEALILFILFPTGAHLFASGVKAMITGGQYGYGNGLFGGNSGLNESSLMAAVAVATIPLYVWVRSHSLILPTKVMRSAIGVGGILVNIPAAIGTFARTGLVGFAVMGTTFWLRSRRKVATGLAILVLAGVGGYVASDRYLARMETIDNYQADTSANIRILVWKWTIDWVKDHPLGGGFNAYVINTIEVVPPTPDRPEGVYQHGRAYHNMYIEYLGEHGYPGLALFVLILLIGQRNLMWITRRTKGVAELAWLHELAKMMQITQLTFMVCGSFIGVGFQPVLWYLIGSGMCMTQYAMRVLPKQGAALARTGGAQSGGPSGVIVGASLRQSTF